MWCTVLLHYDNGLTPGTRSRPHPMSERIKITDTLTEWRYTLKAANASAHTITGYQTSVNQLVKFLEAQGMSTIASEVKTRHLRSFLAYLYEQGKESTTVLTRWAGLRAYFNFAVEIEVCDTNPMHGVARPTITQKVIPEVKKDDIKALLASCDRKTFRGARDYAIMRLLMCGMRRGEIAGLKMDSVNIDGEYPTVTVHGKGAKERRVALGPRDVLALTAYLRARRAFLNGRKNGHRALQTDHLFVSRYGTFTGAGMEQMLTSKCEALGIKGANAHAWRHTWAGEWKAAGGSDEGLMAQGGWSTNREIRRYTAHNRERSSIAEAQRLSITSDL